MAREAHVPHLWWVKQILGAFQGREVACGQNEMGSLGGPVCSAALGLSFPMVNERGWGSVLWAVPMGYPEAIVLRVSGPGQRGRPPASVCAASVFSSCGISGSSPWTPLPPLSFSILLPNIWKKSEKLASPQHRMLSDFQMWGALPSR